MKVEFLLKGGLTGIGAVLAHYTNNISVLFWLLILFEAADYITGIVAAALNEGVSSGEAARGAVKKVCMFFLVGVGYGIDYIILEAKDVIPLNVDYSACVFGVLTICYLLSTEGISILENLGEIGIEVPFLSKILKEFKENISEKGGNKNEFN